MVSVERTKEVVRVEKTLYIPQHHIILNPKLPKSIVIDFVPISKPLQLFHRIINC